MNENFKKVMDSLAEFKTILSGSKLNAKFGEAVLEDGTQIRYDGEELAVGAAVFIVTDTEEVPAPEGTHRLGGDMEGVSIVVDADGFIAEIIDERSNNEVTPEEEQLSAAEIRSIVSEEVATFGKALKSLSKAVESIAKQTEDFKSEFTKLESEFKAYKNMPSNEVKEAEKFAKVNNGGMTSRQLFLLNQMKK